MVGLCVGVIVWLLVTMGGYPLVVDAVRGWFPGKGVEVVVRLSVITQFQSISKGVLNLRDAVYFVTMIAAWLYAGAIIVDMKKAD